MKKYLIIIALFFFCFACEKRIDWEYQNLESQVIVIDALLTNERKKHYITISEVSADINGDQKLVSGAQVNVIVDDTSYLLIEASPGKYSTDSSFQTIINKDYNLSVVYNGKNFEASTYSIPVTPFEPLKYVETNDSGFYRVSQVTSEISTDEAMYEISIDWSHIPGFDTLDYEENHALFYEYSLNSIDEHQIFSAGEAEVTFPLNAIIVEKKYSLTPEHANYIRGLLSETRWRGGAFDVQPANLPTNIQGGAVGYFGASSVIIDTIIVQ
ncbi:MAG: DUF4249 domain-containing protein [Flavobacteriales bacterium]|nr:DUF4249 domain-containing protein [Flavobacteriales bacterium]